MVQELVLEARVGKKPVVPYFDLEKLIDEYDLVIQKYFTYQCHYRPWRNTNHLPPVYFYRMDEILVLIFLR